MADEERRDDLHPRPAHSHLIEFPEALEAFFSRIGELKVVLGPRAAAGVDGLEALIREGLAARDRGDPGRAIQHITQAMRRLAELAADSDAAEAPMLRAMAEQFAAALGRGALGDARAAADVMRERSSSTVIPRRR
jgi:hypothetical protein